MATITLDGIEDEKTLNEYNRRKKEFKTNTITTANRLEALMALEQGFMSWLANQDDQKFSTYYVQSVAEIDGLQTKFDTLRSQAADLIATVRDIQSSDADFPQQPSENA